MRQHRASRGKVVVTDDYQTRRAHADRLQHVALGGITVVDGFAGDTRLPYTGGIQIQRHISNPLFFQQMPDALADAAITTDDGMVAQRFTHIIKRHRTVEFGSD